MQKITFRHCGDMGDIIFSLPAIRHFRDQGATTELALDITGGKGKMSIYQALPQRGYTKFNQKCYDFLKPLLEIQPYITRVFPETSDIIMPNVEYKDLNMFRNYVKFQNLTYSHLAAMHLEGDPVQYTKRWLEVGENNEEKYDVLMNRTLRSQGNHTFWESFIPYCIKEGKKIGFMGTDLEYQVICEVMEVDPAKLPRVIVSDALQMARLIDKCEMFASNEGLPGAIAIALDHKLICEVNKTYPATVFRDKAETGQFMYI